jgi:hypothetical protein
MADSRLCSHSRAICLGGGLGGRLSRLRHRACLINSTPASTIISASVTAEIVVHRADDVGAIVEIIVVPREGIVRQLAVVLVATIVSKVEQMRAKNLL